MAQIEQCVDVGVPLRTAYNQWTQFEEFPTFMEGVEQVRQLDARRLRWRAKVGGKTTTWEAEIVDQIPDQRIAWRSTSGARHAGVVTFHRLGEDRTRIRLQLEYEPAGILEHAGDLLGIVRLRTGGDLDCFKEFIESRGSETGAWRGTISSAGKRRGARAVGS